ncbi:MAG: phosphatidate cytidylyltransferase, partial [Ruminiclostridium sp.]|nr:phosphatidate cytidylyltransferase [Ruminiclostridium sp.]
GGIVIAVLFLSLMFCAILVNHRNVKFEEVGLISFVSICIPLAISTLAFFMFRYEEYGVFFIVYTLVTTWMADGGAYFAGTFFGKHKLAPEISPKKTWEGFVGGVICSALSGALCGFGYVLLDRIALGDESTLRVNIPILAATGFFVAWLGLLGDLSMSLLKRQCSVKDFGNILPGHGGVMDRFDSVVFTAPFVYLVFQVVFPIR